MLSIYFCDWVRRTTVRGNSDYREARLLKYFITESKEITLDFDQWQNLKKSCAVKKGNIIRKEVGKVSFVKNY